MTEYLVRWEIDVEADSPQEAAEKAYVIQKRWNSTATVFQVQLWSEPTDSTMVDLLPEKDMDNPKAAMDLSKRLLGAED